MVDDSTRALAALSIVMDNGINDAVRWRGRAEERLEQAKQACPAIFAEPGDHFLHRIDERMQNYEMELFEYVGRASDADVSPCGKAICEGCELCGKRGHHHLKKKWLTFRHVETPGTFGINANSTTSATWYHALNGGMRDVAWAWNKVFDVYRDDGTKDEDMICLPPDMCYCFRKAGELCDCGD
jgi:hypothetical protein